MTYRTHADLRRVVNHGSKDYILKERLEKKLNFRKTCKNFSAVSGHLM